jgi:tetratricopeptide (TPR) repeat protein
LHLHSILVSEANGLFTQLPPSYNIIEAQHQPNNLFFQAFIPFELILLRVTLPVYLRGDLYLVLQQLQETAYGCRLEYQRTGNSAWIANLRATAVSMVNVLYRLQELEQAMALLRQIADDSGKPQTLVDLCLLALDMGDIDTATSFLDKIRDTPDSSIILSTLEVARLLCDGQFKEAEVLARSNREQTRDDLISKANLAACCMYNGKVQEVS